MENKIFFVNVNFGSLQLYNLSFNEAADAIENHIKAEQKASDRLVNEINKDNWFRAYCSELLGGAEKPPTANEWMYPLSVLKDARNAYFGKHYAAAQNLLVSAFEFYKGLHKRWMEYRNRLILGGERSVALIELSITILSAVATAGAGASVMATGTAAKIATNTAAKIATNTAAKIVTKAVLAAGVKGTETASRQLGSWVQMDEGFDISKFALDTGSAFASSLLGGALSEAFKGCMTPKLLDLVRADSSFESALILKGIKHNAMQQFVADFIGKLPLSLVLEAVKKAAEQAKGKSLKTIDFIEFVAVQLSKQSVKSLFKAYIDSRK